jgi:Na+-driven multidrug efflux pump
VISLLLFFGGYTLFALFLPEPEIRAMGAVYLRILAICQIPGCLEAVGSGMFRGMGRTVSPSMVSIASNILRVPACYLLASTHLALHGVWWGITLSAVLRGAVIFLWALAVLLRKRGKFS